MPMAMTVILVLALAAALIGGFAFVWLGDKKRADEVGDDSGRVDRDRS